MAECIHDLDPAACSMCSGRGEEIRAAGHPVFYVLACRDCGDPDRPLIMPFGSPAERGKWASGHTRATGHDRWFVADQGGDGGMVLTFDQEAVDAVTRMWQETFAHLIGDGDG